MCFVREGRETEGSRVVLTRIFQFIMSGRDPYSCSREAGGEDYNRAPPRASVPHHHAAGELCEACQLEGDHGEEESLFGAIDVRRVRGMNVLQGEEAAGRVFKSWHRRFDRSEVWDVMSRIFDGWLTIRFFFFIWEVYRK